MSQHLHKLLGIPASRLNSVVQRLEKTTGNSGTDVRLTAEIIGKAHLTVRSLGLDPQDSTPSELHASLCHLLELHDGFMRDHIGIGDDMQPDEIVERASRYVQKLHVPKLVWVAKKSVIKKYLKNVPPRRTMKKLGYRSADSMIKREPTVNILAIAAEIESKSWHDKYYAQYDSLRPIDFEERNIEIIHPTSRHWREVGAEMSSKIQSNILTVKELGAVVVLPLPRREWPVVCLTIFALTLLAMHELRVYSSFFKLQTMSHSFGSDIVRAVTRGNDALSADLGPDDVHWRVLHNFFADTGLEDHPEFFQPHLTVEDFALRKVEDVLIGIEPAFQFWKDAEFVGGFYADDPSPVSFNILDAIINCSNNVSVDDRVITNMQSALWDELLVRYLGSQHVRSIVLKQLSGAKFDIPVAT